MDLKLSFEIESLLAKIKAIPGGYVYSGAASIQYCFPLKAGGELRFSLNDETYPELQVDLYDGAILPGISGPVSKTGT